MAMDLAGLGAALALATSAPSPLPIRWSEPAAPAPARQGYAGYTLAESWAAWWRGPAAAPVSWPRYGTRPPRSGYRR